ncbi:hypothetical protein [Thalassotalea mangrovi]|uniref:Uncharacterized protein n=1 Tax=Thalassotalea mangrovi TaxID=2572245 RepID=A0A4U1B473_9GAMM|nr:hypothetical protein [Thalassotalea mangrovi]TKB44712.1 hypothetical protein E8M12_11305 [Thalassotalea mangrovi]
MLQLIRLFRLVFTAQILIVISIYCSFANATALKYRSLTQLANAADAIMIASVDAISSQRMANGAIVSFVTLADLNLIRGTYDQEQLTLVIHGGEVDGLVQRIQGVPQFSITQQVILFLQGNGERMVPISGWGQGMFIINNGLIYDYQGNPVTSINNDRITINRLKPADVVLVNAPKNLPANKDLAAISVASFLNQIKQLPHNQTAKPVQSIDKATYSPSSLRVNKARLIEQ